MIDRNPVTACRIYALGQALSVARFSPVKITGAKVWLVEGIKYNWTMLKIYTDTEHTGVGEATNWPGSPIIEAAMRHVAEPPDVTDPANCTKTESLPQ